MTTGHISTHDKRYLVRYEDVAEPQRALALVAVPAAFVVGKVVNASGSPVPYRSCTLHVNDGDRWSQMAHAASQRGGSLHFAGVHALDADLRIEAVGPVGSAHSEACRAEAGTQVESLVAVPTPGRIPGRVLDAAGAPLVGARLMVQNHHLDSGQQIDGSWTNVMTDRDGRYSFTGVSATGHKISVKGGNGRTLFTTDLFGVGAGEIVKQDIRLPE